MRRGRLRCLGSIQHLKNKFGLGYLLDIKLALSAVRVNLLIDHDDHKRAPQMQNLALRSNNAVMLLQQEFPYASLMDRRSTRLQFHIPQQQLGLSSLSKLFLFLNQHKEILGIAEFAITQSSLEQIFISVAQNYIFALKN